MKKILLFLVAMFSIVALSAQSITKADWKFWEPVMEAISKIESSQNPKAVSKSGKYVGYLQIAPVCVEEANNVVGKKKYTLNDRYSIKKSKEIFVLIQQKYNKAKDIQKAIRIWNGGCRGWRSSKTLSYYNRVMKNLSLTASK